MTTKTTNGKTSGQVLGYRRASTADQRLDRQLVDVDIDRTFDDHASGGNVDRPGLDALLDHMREGDAVVVHSLDRLARSLPDLLGLVEKITGKGVTVRFVKEGLTFAGDEGDPLSQLMLSMLGAVAQFERALIRERSAEGMAVARTKGVRFGRPPALTATQRAQIVAEHAAGKSIRALAQDFDVGRGTVQRALDGAKAEA